MVTEDQYAGIATARPVDVRPGRALDEDGLPAEAALDDSGDGFGRRRQGIDIARGRLDFDECPEVLDHRVNTHINTLVRGHAVSVLRTP